MSKKRMVLSIALILCVVFVTTAFEWNFDDIGKKKTEEPVAEEVAEPVAEEAAESAEEPVAEEVAEPVEESAAEGTGTCGQSVSYGEQDYVTVQIGEQCWMAESLDIGEQIDSGIAMANDGKIQKYCYQNEMSNCPSGGGLYTWTEAMGYTEDEGVQGICPDGWHIPTDGEWHILEVALAEGDCDQDREDYGCDPAGEKLRSGGSSGFNGVIQGGPRTPGADFVEAGEMSFWSSTRTEDPLTRTISADSTMFRRLATGSEYGLAVRCIKN